MVFPRKIHREISQTTELVILFVKHSLGRSVLFASAMEVFGTFRVVRYHLITFARWRSDNRGHTWKHRIKTKRQVATLIQFDAMQNFRLKGANPWKIKLPHL